MRTEIQHAKLEDGALGRNGIMATSAVVVESFYKDSIRIGVLTGKGAPGRAWIAVPRDEAVIGALCTALHTTAKAAR